MTAATAFGILLALIVLVAVRLNLRSVTIYEYERGLKYSRGRFRGVLEAGQYWYLTRLTTVRKVDVRVAVLAVSGQEVLSRDGVALKVSVAAKYRVVDPAQAVNGVENFIAALHTELQLALRSVISGSAVDDLLEARPTLGKQLVQLAAGPVRATGLELLEAEVRALRCRASSRRSTPRWSGRGRRGSRRSREPVGRPRRYATWRMLPR